MITIAEAREAVTAKWGFEGEPFTLRHEGIHPWGGSIFTVSVKFDENDYSEDRVRVYRNDAGELVAEDTNL